MNHKLCSLKSCFASAMAVTYVEVCNNTSMFFYVDCFTPQGNIFTLCARLELGAFLKQREIQADFLGADF